MKIGELKVYGQRLLQYVGFANFAMLIYLTQKSTTNFWLYALVGLAATLGFLYYDSRAIMQAELDFMYEKSRHWMKVEKMVEAIYNERNVK